MMPAKMATPGLFKILQQWGKRVKAKSQEDFGG